MIQTDIYIGGSFSSSTFLLDTIELINTGDYDVFVGKMNLDGEFIWAKSFSGDNAENVTSMVINNNIIISGYYKSPEFEIGNSTYYNEGGDDIFLAQIDFNGNIYGSLSISNSGGAISHSMTLDINNDLIIAGAFSSDLFFGNHSIYSYGSGDAFVTKYRGLITANSVIEIAETKKINFIYDFYNSRVNLEYKLDKKQQVSICLYDITGKIAKYMTKFQVSILYL